MVNRTLGACVIAVVVLCSGCAGLFGGPSSPGERQSVTPAPVPTVEQTPTRSLAATNESIDPIALGQTDRRIRKQSSYRVERTVRIATPNETVTYRWMLRATPDGQRAGELQARGGGPLAPSFDRISFWGNDTVLVARSESADSSPVVTRFRDGDPAPYRPGDGLLPQALAGGDFFTARYDDPQAVVRSAEPFRLPAEALPFATEPSDDVTVQVTIASTGLLRSVEIRYRAVYHETPVQVTVQERTTGVGETNVTRPEWVHR